jgi:hypothetical protein
MTGMKTLMPSGSRNDGDENPDAERFAVMAEVLTEKKKYV